MSNDDGQTPMEASFKGLMDVLQRVVIRTNELIWNGHKRRKRVTGDGYPIVNLVKGEDMAEETGRYMLQRGVPVPLDKLGEG